METLKIINYKRLIESEVKNSKKRIKIINNRENYPLLTEEEKNNIEKILMKHYRENKLISISCVNFGKINNYSGIIEQIDLVHKKIHLIPKKIIKFKKISGIKK